MKWKRWKSFFFCLLTGSLNRRKKRSLRTGNRLYYTKGDSRIKIICLLKSSSSLKHIRKSWRAWFYFLYEKFPYFLKICFIFFLLFCCILRGMNEQFKDFEIKSHIDFSSHSKWLKLHFTVGKRRKQALQERNFPY